MDERTMYWDNELQQYTLRKEADAPDTRYAAADRGDDGFIAETWYTDPDGQAVRIMFSEDHYQDPEYRKSARQNMERRNQCPLCRLLRIKLPADLYDRTFASLTDK